MLNQFNLLTENRRQGLQPLTAVSTNPDGGFQPRRRLIRALRSFTKPHGKVNAEYSLLTIHHSQAEPS